MSAASLAADLVVAQQQHEPPAGAHLVLLAGVVVTALAIFGVRWWRGRRGVSEEQPAPHDRSADNTHPTEDE